MKKAQAARRAGETKDERQRRFAPKSPVKQMDVPYHLHGLHAVQAAILNPRRGVRKLLATQNALDRIDVSARPNLNVETVTPKALDELLGSGTVHQGLAALIDPLPSRTLESPYPALSIMLDQVTDPHNVGAIVRSAAAFNAGAVISTARHGASETATLAKSASGALELVPMVTVRNLAESIESLRAAGTLIIGLDSGADEDLTDALGRSMTATQKAKSGICLVLGSEGKGLRQKTKASCTAVARLPLTGSQLSSLNVSNAAVLALYIASQFAESSP
ncbi:MAG: RNA methyltransferase [Pseudomonadota bacterium]